MVVTSDCHSTDDFTRKHLSITISQPNIFRLPVYTFLHRPLKLISVTLSKGPIFKIIPFIKVLIKLLKFSPDLIIAGPLPTTVVLYASFFKKLTGAKLLINPCFHPTDTDFIQPLLLKSLKSADYLWTLTEFETEYFRQQLKISVGKLLHLGIGIDKNFLIKTDKLFPKFPNLLYIGSFSAHKGIDTLIKSFSLLPSPVTLTLAGQPTLYFPLIKKQINSLPSGTKNRINIIKNFSSSHLSRLIDKSTILILPSRQESFGLVLIEALARKTPIITSDIPQLSEFISRFRSGLTFKLDDSADLIRQIQKLIMSPKQSKTFGQNGFKFVSKHYTWDKIGKSLCQKLSL